MYHSLIQVLTAARLIARHQGADKQEIAEATGLSQRSVYRLIEALEGRPPDGLGYPIYPDEGQSGRWKLNSTLDRARYWLPVPSADLDSEDRIILTWLLDHADANPALSEPLEKLRIKIGLLGAAGGASVVTKVTGAGPEMGKQSILLSSFQASKPVPERSQAILKRLFQAIDRHLVCEVSYEALSTGQVRTYDIHPLALFEQGGGIYLFVFVPFYGTIRLLALERIRALDCSTTSFKPPKDFDAAQRLSDPFGIVSGEEFTARIQFSNEQAPYIRERSWPSGCTLTALADGGLIFQVTTTGEYELSRWILSQGPSAEVLEPDWLRKSIQQELRKTLVLYSAKPRSAD